MTIFTKSNYTKVFDSNCEHWFEDQEVNLLYLKAQQRFANDKLKANGYLFLNDVYDLLGIPRTKTGQIVGWYYDLTNAFDDNHIDFGINEKQDGSGIELDFNVDGYIIDRLED